MVPRILKFCYYMVIVSAFCANMLVVSHTTSLSVLGAGMALRGPDGSMMTATDGFYEERGSVFRIFGFGLACTVGSVVLCVWLILSWEAALVCMLITIICCRRIWQNYTRVQQRFGFDENETVDFRDIFEGPANIQLNRKTLKPSPMSMPVPSMNSSLAADPYDDLELQMAASKLLHQRRPNSRDSSPPHGQTDALLKTV